MGFALVEPSKLCVLKAYWICDIPKCRSVDEVNIGKGSMTF